MEQSNDEKLSQNDYQETAYADSSWTVIGERLENLEFIPMQVAVVGGASFKLDPMFADFGGRAPPGSEKRWHASAETTEELSPKQVSEEQQLALVQQHQAEMKGACEEAYAKGQRDAMDANTIAQTEKLTAMEGRLTEVMQDLAQQLQERFIEIEKNAVKLTLEISHKIVGHAVEINPEYVHQLLHHAILKAGSSEVRTVRVSPQDVEFLKIVGLSKQLKELKVEWNFVADESIKAGCVIETSAGEVDFDLDKAFARISDQVLKVIA